MQVIRLVQTGFVDKVIGFDELPQRLLNGVEMRRPDGLPRHWKSFIGEHTKVTPPSMEKNPVTGKSEVVGGGSETGPFFYVLYYTEINKDKERWQEICQFVRRTVELKFRLLDKIEEMALPFSTDANAELKLEPENMEERGAIIPIPLEFQEKSPAILDKNGKEVVPELPPDPSMMFQCKVCGKTFSNERGLVIHMARMHGDSEKK
jgi:hypothetical protein